jgi:hypothetical protein
MKRLPLLILLLAGTTHAQTTPMKAASFIGTIGVNVRLPQGDDTVTQIEDFAAYTGVKHARMEATHANTGIYGNTTDALPTIYAATRMTFDMIGIVDDVGAPTGCVVSPSNPYCGSYLDELYFADTGATQGWLDPLGIEGPNEPNNEPFTYVSQGGVTASCGPFGSTFKGCALWLQDVYAGVHADSNLTHFFTSGISQPGSEFDNWGLSFATVPTGQGTLNDGAVYSNAINVHNCYNLPTLTDNEVWGAAAYPAYSSSGNFCNASGQCIDSWLGQNVGLTWAEGFQGYTIASAANVPHVSTETGAYTTGGYTFDQQGKTAVALFIDSAINGTLRTYWYTAFDQTSDGTSFGWYKSDHATPKNAAVYIHNLTTILADSTTNFTVTPITVGVSGAPSTVHTLLMEKSNGTYYLAVSDEAFASQTVSHITVNFASPRTIPLTVSDHAVIVSF